MIVDQHTREQFFINALVTEHFVLQSARGAMIGEMVGRGSIYLGSVSSSLIAFGFTRSRSFDWLRSSRLCYPRSSSWVNSHSSRCCETPSRISSSCVGYRRSAATIGGLLPEAEEFFDPPGQDRKRQSEMATVGLRRGAAALLFTGASTIAAINSILGGAGLALFLAHTIRLDETTVTAVGVVAAVLLFGRHLAYEHWRNIIPGPAAASRGANRGSAGVPI